MKYELYGQLPHNDPRAVIENPQWLRVDFRSYE